MRSSKTPNDAGRAGLGHDRPRRKPPADFRHDRLHQNSPRGLRRRLRMALFIQQALVCAASLLLALSCARVEPAANNNNAHTPGGSPDEPLLTAAEPVVLSPEDQTEDALNSTRRADASGRAEGGGLPQLTPQEH